MTLRDTIEEHIEYGARWTEADDVPRQMRAQLIAAWREDATPSEISEAYLNGSDNDADLSTLLAFSLNEVLTHEAQQAMLNCFWAGMSWRVDKEIERVREDIEQPEPLEPIPYRWQEDAA